MTKIFCVGLSRTGTYSLHRALLMLGFSSKHWDYTKQSLRYNGNELDVDFSWFEQFDAFLDTPVARFYRELDERFPGSKFILTERNTEDWLRSYKQFFKPYSPDDAELPSLRMDLYRTYGHEDEILRESFEKHNREVKEYFRKRPDDLLCIIIGEGKEWEKLCSFLSVPVPERPFPKANTKSEYKLINFYIKHKAFIDTVMPKSVRKKVADAIWPDRPRAGK